MYEPHPFEYGRGNGAWDASCKGKTFSTGILLPSVAMQVGGSPNASPLPWKESKSLLI